MPSAVKADVSMVSSTEDVAEGGQDEPAPIPVNRDDDRHCHCQGHRLAVVIGPRSNDAIGAAVNWVQSLTNVQHKLYCPVATVGENQPLFEHPELIEATGPAAFRATTNDPIKEFLGTKCNDCCHWDEVLLVCHGGQYRIWYALLKNLARLLGNRPLRKFVLWMCQTGAEFCPDHPISVEGRDAQGKIQKLGRIKVFEQIAFLLQPKSCSVTTRCGCNHNNCVCMNADGRTAPPHCPDGTEPVKLLCAAWYRFELQDETTVIHRAAAVGIQQMASGNWELTSPNGKVREVSIAPNGNVTTADPAATTNVFAGTPLVADPALEDHEQSTRGNISVKKRMQPTKVVSPNPDPTPPYTGPTVCPNTGGDGCQPDAV